MDKSVLELYGNLLRVRVCGICIRNDQLLLVNHRGLVEGDFWSFPGGGMQFGETAKECLTREFLEETGLTVEVGDFLFTCEFISVPLHAIELFFIVNEKEGNLRVGTDPESGRNQIIQNVAFMAQADLSKINKAHLHGIFNKTEKIDEIIALRGYFKL
ncbi:MAG: NUDIX hydrolase [Cyclobacteriaceae bacterium]|nr:NUDIX hydrolase [Cyclobacteriaceae bacterium]